MSNTNEVFMKLEVDAVTGSTTERAMTPDEVAEIEAMRLETIADKNEREAKADARASALAKLADLGLTQDEINAL
jgi:hypothetical protein